MQDVPAALIYGYGNPDREDDGVAWHILSLVCQKLGRPAPSEPEEEFLSTGISPDIIFALQLTPEVSELASRYERVCFVDAHTGAIEDDLHTAPVESHFQSSPFTHHLTPESCLSMVETLYGKKPEAVLVSVRGYRFGFARTLSEPTSRLAEKAADWIINWLNEK